jgi:phosphoserine phosphatase
MHILTLVVDREAASLDPATVARVREAVGGGAVDVLSPGEAADIFCVTPPDPAEVAAGLAGAAVDAIAVPASGRRKRLLISDMDGTIVTSETLDELAAHAGVGARVAEITRRSMNGQIDFADALRERVAMLRGLELSALEATWRGVRLMPGAAELVATMRAHGAVTLLVTGGFTWFSARVAAWCGFDLHRANTLHDDGARLTGTLGEPILDRAAKRAALHEVAAAHGVDLAETLAVGDGANDLDMIEAAGLGVAFHAKPIVAAAARARVDHAGLRALLFAQGYRAAQIVG